MEGTGPGTIATPWRRLGGWLLDALILGIIVSIPVQFVLGSDPDPGPFAAVVLVESALAFVYLIVFDATSGATLGKRIVGTSVVDAETRESSIGYRRAIVRRLGYAIGWLCLLLGWLWCIWDRQHQAWHDKFGKTLVVRT